MINIHAGKTRFCASCPTPGLDLTRQFHNMPSVSGLFTIQSEFRYEIVRKICDGGMGIVYEAEQHGAGIRECDSNGLPATARPFSSLHSHRPLWQLD